MFDNYQRRVRLRGITIAFLTFTLFSCTNTSGNQNGDTTNTKDIVTAAVRINVTQQGQLELQNVIAKSINQKKIKLTKSTLVKSDTLYIERKVLFGNDYSRPTVFKLLKLNDKCFVLNQKTQHRYLLANTKCKAYTP